MGLKAVAVYRDGCKRTQPLNTGGAKKEPEMRESGVSLDAPSVRINCAGAPEGAKAYRRRLPDVRKRRCPSFLGRWAGRLSNRRSV